MESPLETVPPILNAAQKRIASQRLQRLVDQKLLTEAGLAWLILATDPWHDNPVSGVKGCPDENIGKSVVMPVNTEVQITKGGLAAGNWSARISTNPICRYIGLTRYTHWPQLNFPSSDGLNHFIAPVMVEKQLDSVGTFADGYPLSAGVVEQQVLELAARFRKGSFKVIGWGLELVNTTASLHKQGLLTVTRYNQGHGPATERVCSADPLTSYNQTWITVNPVRFPPQTLTEMLEHQGVQQWEAAEGVYAVVPLKNLNAPASGCSPTLPMLTDDTDGAIPGAQIIVYIPSPASSTATGMSAAALAVVGGEKFVPSDGVCIMLTGLSDETSLTLRSRWIVERFPGNDEQDILAIATPSAYFDPLALEIYSRTMQKMPPGVMFKENPEGEWFSRLLGTLADMAGPMIGLIPHPAAKAIGAGLTAARAANKPTVETVAASPPVQLQKKKKPKVKKPVK